VCVFKLENYELFISLIFRISFSGRGKPWISETAGTGTADRGYDCMCVQGAALILCMSTAVLSCRKLAYMLGDTIKETPCILTSFV
jgi:hypothetical protein